ncbi:NADH:flavin oxidoreductase/NADH oxidase [Bradyrhizobium sp. 87]|uniref:NADH:flavin oxidoreductase/NADH oxidase n=1 Tax=Bradyrhizobium sp. 87 TaxID=2782682 RepID=UPI001FF82DDC|nr:NADH:flavin oxidoreductase/NADH oxidase [Bradyrhizobium sp. 87]MCK1433432.1 NADH:flavin oxidoreductase/NADH oxidase [Bradyrhizobium sp. 87]
MDETLLFSPLRIRDVEIKNRIVVPPMLQYVADRGFPTPWHITNAGKFAAGGAGLVIVESTKVERRGCGTVGDLGIWDDKFIAPLRDIASFIKSNGAAAGIQLGHTGRKGKARRPWEGDGTLSAQELAAVDDVDGWGLIGPSALAFGNGYFTPRALERHEIPDAIDAWGKAAARADQAGFDVVELHAAHGYLIHSFLSPEANQRTDDYGGSEANRMRFAIEVAESVRANWPAPKPLFVRLSIEDEAGWGPAENARLVRIFKTKGVDVIDCSTGGLNSKVPNFFRLNEYGYQVQFADYIRREADIMTMAVGLIIHGDQAEAILQDKKADLVAVGREFIHNPNWAMDAAQKLGVDPTFSAVPPQMGYWLEKRARRGFGGNPSTWQKGIASDS